MNISIIGSCVTRDIFEYDKDVFKINDYFARSSIVSMTSLPIDVNSDYVQLNSPFQKKCVLNDLNKHSIQSVLNEDNDYLIIDLIDERFNLYYRDGSFVTKSNELVSSGFDLSDFKEMKKGS